MDFKNNLLIKSKKECSDIVIKKNEINFDVDDRDSNGWTKLYTAASKGRLEVVKELFKSGANINNQDSHGQTVLHKASSNGHLDIVKELIKFGININIQDKDGWTALQTASWEGHLNVVKELIKSGANIDILNSDGWTALHIASLKNYLDIVKELIRSGANINIIDNDGLTAVQAASILEHSDIVKDLTKAKFDIDIRDNNGRTVVRTASSERCSNVAKELIESRVGNNVRDNKNKISLIVRNLLLWLAVFPSSFLGAIIVFYVYRLFLSMILGDGWVFLIFGGYFSNLLLGMSVIFIGTSIAPNNKKIASILLFSAFVIVNILSIIKFNTSSLLWGVISVLGAIIGVFMTWKKDIN